MLAATDPAVYAVLAVAAVPVAVWLFRKPKMDTPEQRHKQWVKTGAGSPRFQGPDDLPPER